MRYLLAALLVLPFCLVDEPRAQDAPEVDVLNLYKLVGRSWTTRSVKWKRGSPATTDMRRVEITVVAEAYCTIRTTTLDKDGFDSGDQSTDLRFTDDLKAASRAAKDAQNVRLAAAGRSFEATLSEVTTEASHEQTWRSAKYPALVLRQRIVRADYVETLDLLQFGEGVADPWTLYRMSGRKWVYRINEELKSPDPRTSYLVNEVLESSAEGAKVKVTHLDKDKKPVKGDLGDTQIIDFEKATPWKAPEKAKDQDVIEGTLNVANVKWASIEVRGSDQSEFYSKNWPGLLLKRTRPNSEMALVEFYTGHDEMRFYRTQGNHYTMRMTYSFGGVRMADSSNYQQFEVTAVKDGRATYRIKSLDSVGRVQYSSESTTSITPYNPRAAAGEEPVEERIYTAAGVIQCLRSARKSRDTQTQTWTYHGINVRMTTESDGYNMRQEVTELKLE